MKTNRVFKLEQEDMLGLHNLIINRLKEMIESKDVLKRFPIATKFPVYIELRIGDFPKGAEHEKFTLRVIDEISEDVIIKFDSEHTSKCFEDIKRGIIDTLEKENTPKFYVGDIVRNIKDNNHILYIVINKKDDGSLVLVEMGNNKTQDYTNIPPNLLNEYINVDIMIRCCD